MLYTEQLKGGVRQAGPRARCEGLRDHVAAGNLTTCPSFLCLDVHGMVQLPPPQGGNADREHRGGLPGWPEAHAAAGSHLR